MIESNIIVATRALNKATHINAIVLQGKIVSEHSILQNKVRKNVPIPINDFCIA